MFPTRIPLCTYLALALSLCVAAAFFLVWKGQASPLQAFYLSPASKFLYLRTQLPHFGRHLPTYQVFTGGDSLATERTPADRLRYTTIAIKPEVLHEMLARAIYAGGLDVTWRWPLWISGAFAFVALIIGGLLDRKRRQRFREGMLLRGPKIVTPRQYNRKTKGDGIWIELA